jgi:hypothetical protein
MEVSFSDSFKKVFRKRVKSAEIEIREPINIGFRTAVFKKADRNPLHPFSGILLIAYSAKVVIVKLGFTPRFP